MKSFDIQLWRLPKFDVSSNSAQRNYNVSSCIIANWLMCWVPIFLLLCVFIIATRWHQFTKSRTWAWRTSFRDVLVTETSIFGDRFGRCLGPCWSGLEKATSWRLDQEKRPLDTMQNWTNYWTVRVDIKCLTITSGVAGTVFSRARNGTTPLPVS